MTVVLPAPFGPISAWRAPFSTLSETSLAATMPPKRFSRPMVSSAGAMAQRSFADGRRLPDRTAPPLPEQWNTRAMRCASQKPARRQPMTRSRPTSTITTSTRPIQNCQYCGVRLAS